MSDVYDYRTFRIARASWPALARSVHGEIAESLHGQGGSMFGLFGGLIGFASDEGVMLSAWPDADTLGADAAKILAAAPGIIESTSERLTPTVHPINRSPIARAAPGDVYVSSTVKDLVAGSELRFADRGAHSLKGLDGEWRLFAVER